MSFIKRLSATFYSQFDEAVSRIENHDAVIETTLKESREAIAHLKVQQSRTRQEIQRADEQLKKLQEDERKWTVRAKQAATGNEEQALACLERRDSCREQIERVHKQKEQGVHLESRLADNLSRLETNLAREEQRLREFRGRDLSARAEKGMSRLAGSDSIELEQAFERWELDLVRKELGSCTAEHQRPDGDPLEERLLREERLASRRAELKELMKEEES